MSNKTEEANRHHIIQGLSVDSDVPGVCEDSGSSGSLKNARNRPEKKLGARFSASQCNLTQGGYWDLPV